MYRVSSVPAYTLQSPHPGVAAADNPQPVPRVSSLDVSQNDGGVKQSPEFSLAAWAERECSKGTRVWTKDCWSRQSLFPICSLANIQPLNKQSHATGTAFYLMKESLASVCLSKASLTCKTTCRLWEGCICVSSYLKSASHTSWVVQGTKQPPG